MKTIIKFVGATSTMFVAATSAVFAAPSLTVPEPGSLALVGLAVAGLVFFSRKGKK